MEHHAISALIRRSGPEASRRALLFLHCFRRVRLTPVVPPKDRVMAPNEPRHVGADETTGDDPSGTFFGTKLSLDCILYAAHAMISFDHSPPKFVFAVCPASVVLRSADRGKTWRKITLSRALGAATKVPSPPPKVVSAAAPASQEDDDEDDNKQLADILGLLPSDAAGADAADSDDDAADKASVVEAPAARTLDASRVTIQPDLLGVACWQDTIAVCGEDGMLAVSVDRGVTFSYADPQLHLGLIHNRTKSKHALHAIKGVVFLSGTTLAFYTTSQVLRLSFTVQGLNTVVYDKAAVSVLKLPQGPIGGMWAMDWGEGEMSDRRGARPLWVSTNSLLRFSCDGGASWLPVPHSIGLIRAAVFPSPAGPRPPPHPDWTSALSAVGVLPVPQASTMDAPAPPSSLAPATKTNAPQEAPQPNKVFSFALESKFTAAASESNSSTSLAALQRCSFPSSIVTPSEETALVPAGKKSVQPLRAASTPIRSRSNPVAASPSEDGVVVMVCYALSTNGKIVPYDFTSVLHIACTVGMDPSSPTEVRLHSIASRVDYLPFVQSTIQDRVGLDMAQRRSDEDGGDSHVLIRSTAAGVSSSRSYGERWTEPARSFTGTCCRLDEGSFVFGCQKKSVIITEDYGATFKAHAIPTAMRVAVITDIAIMK